jgi:hypothetical protein
MLVKFVLLTMVYGIFSFIVVLITAARTCGITPDSVELCDLTPLTIVQVGLGVGYVGLATYFYRTRVSGHL